MKQFLLTISLLVLSGMAVAATDKPLYDMQVDLGDESSLQRGARLFVNYCMGCHSAKFMRYNRLGKDLGISEDVLQANLMFETDKPGDTMQTAMPAEQAEQWFGVAPPDLTLSARARGADWLYSYLLTFYKDSDTTTGFNNLQFRGAAMPHVLWELQGIKRAVKQDDGSTKLETVKEGRMTDAEYRGAMRDLVNFMVYISEPAQMERYRIGFWVIFYLLILLVVVYMLKREFWRDVY